MGNENPPFKINFPFRDFWHMIYKSYPIIAQTSVKLFFPLKDDDCCCQSPCSFQSWSVRRLQGLQRIFCMDRLTGQHLCVYQILHFSFYFMFWASVVGSVACKRVLWNINRNFHNQQVHQDSRQWFCSCISTNSIKQRRGLAVLQIESRVAL